jgi:TolB-like protein/class 3 adenylate cyclase
MGGTRKIAAILVADIVGYSRLAGTDEDRTLSRLRGLRTDLIDPAIDAHHGRIVKRTGDGSLIEFRSVVDAVRCAMEVQNGMIERNAGVPTERRIEFRIGIHLGDVVEESDGDLMGDGVNIAARLEGICEPGAICLSEDAYRQVKSRLDLKVTDLGLTNLKNIAEPIRVYSLQVGVPAQARPASHLSPAQKSGPPRLSIVVLPFANMGGDQEQDYFIDGVTESLTTDLSRIRGMLVIGRNTAFTFKGKAVALKQIGVELNVRYVLEGSVQRGGDRMRVNVQLIDAETGNHLWAERFDKPVADLFDMQDEIVARLANQLSTELISAEARRSEGTQSPDSFDFLFQGLAWHNKGPMPENMAQARGFFERALALDPDNVDALVMRAMVDFFVAVYLLSEDRVARLGGAEAGLIKALSLAPEHALAHYCLGMVVGVTNRPEEGIAECERALAIDRNLAGAHAVIGARKLYLGRAHETEAHVKEALRLSPRDTSAFLWLTAVGAAEIFLGHYDQAVVWLRRSIEANRNNPLTHVFLAAALAILGRPDEAQAAARAALVHNPQLTIARFKVFFAQFNENQFNIAGRDLIIESVRRAGVPEG